MSTVGAEGAEESLIGLLRGLGVEKAMLDARIGNKWRRGTRTWEGWISERDGEQRKMANVTIIWDVPMDERVQGHVEGKKSKRKIFFRVHPSAFFQVWSEILKVAKIQRPVVMIEDLRFEIGSIQVMGPGSTEALISALRPVSADEPDMEPRIKPETKSDIPQNDIFRPGILQPDIFQSDILQPDVLQPENMLEIKPEINSETKPDIEPEIKPQIEIETRPKISSKAKPEQIWPHLCDVTNPACLPPNALLGFEICDPRLHYPPRTVQSTISEEALLQILTRWPPDQSLTSLAIFDRQARVTACGSLSSQKSINRRKGNALPGAYPDPLPQDPRIPILLAASRPPSRGGAGSYTLLLPWDTVFPVWCSLINCPLKTGGSPFFGGLQEQRQIALEQGIPWFPGDFPGTKAGWEWERIERENRKAKWEKRPKGKRVAWESVDLGGGVKGEIGIGWACDWERLFQGGPSCSSTGADAIDQASVMSTEAVVAAAAAAVARVAAAMAVNTPQTVRSPPQVPPEFPSLPFNIHQVLSPVTASLASPTALVTICITPLSRGNPSVCARIYRLPTTDSALRDAWITQIRGPKPDPPPTEYRAPRRSRTTGFPEEEETPAHIRRQQLAAELLAPPSDRQAEPAYPRVPGEEDLIGFVTTGNFDLSQGRARAIGCVALARVEIGAADVDYREQNRVGAYDDSVTKNVWVPPVRSRGPAFARHCIVRDAGQSMGRLAMWSFV